MRLSNMTGVLAGSQFKYDLVSKARAVEAIKTNSMTIEEVASDLRIKESTAKAWYSRYKDSYESFLDLPAGVMVVYKYAFLEDAIYEAIDLVERHYDESLALKQNVGFQTQFDATGGVDWNAAS